MPDRDAQLEQFKSHLADACPSRLVTRNHEPIDRYQHAQLESGVLTIVTTGEGDYPNLRDRLGEDGRQRVELIGYLRVAEKADKVAIEQAELALYEEVLAGLANAPGVMRCIDVVDFRQSGQQEHPYGWIAVSLEWQK